MELHWLIIEKSKQTSTRASLHLILEMQTFNSNINEYNLISHYNM